MTKEYVSECHGVYVYWLKHWREQFPDEYDYTMTAYCSKCHKPCEVIEKEEI